MVAAPSFPDGDRLAHVIVCGNEKRGSGKTTTAMHLLVELLYNGFSVASIDLDTCLRGLTRYIESRAAWNRQFGTCLPVPDHYWPEHCDGQAWQDDNVEIRQLQVILEQTETTHDFIIVDLPSRDSLAVHMAHCLADTLVTPLNVADLDLDLVAQIDPATLETGGISKYGEMVREARRNRRAIDNGLLDWAVVRSRMSGVRNERCRKLMESLTNLAARLGFRIVGGLSEKPMLQELFPTGLTALDPLNGETFESHSTLCHLSARLEVRSLIAALRLPVDETARRRAEARRAWLCNSRMPVGSDEQFRRILRRPAKHRFAGIPDSDRLERILEAELAVAGHGTDIRQ